MFEVGFVAGESFEPVLQSRASYPRSPMTGCRDAQSDFWRVIRATKNWYGIIPVVTRLRRQATIEFKNGLKFYYVRGLFSVEHFLEQPYRIAEVKGRDVVDVGAFSGDSSIYFAWRGARRVFAFEPVPASYKMANMNIRLNGIDNVQVFNEAIGAVEGNLSMPVDTPGSSSFSSSEKSNIHSEAVRIPIRTLDSIVRDFELEGAVLKMDCEGCEYEVIPNANDDTLRCFTQIILEYHRGAQGLLERLTDSGFDTKLLDIKGRPIHVGSKTLGLVYASR